MADKRFKQPTRVVVVNEDGTTAAAASSEPLEATGAYADVVASVPKSMKPKSDRLMKHHKNDPTTQ